MKTYRVYIANASPEGLVRSASLNFGGATVTTGLEAWTNEQGETVIEPTNVVTIATDNRADVVQWAVEYAHIIGESAILVEDPDGANNIEWTGRQHLELELRLDPAGSKATETPWDQTTLDLGPEDVA